MLAEFGRENRVILHLLLALRYKGSFVVYAQVNSTIYFSANLPHYIGTASYVAIKGEKDNAL